MMKTKILYFLLFGLFLVGCSPRVNQTPNEPVTPITPTVFITETATQQSPTPTAVPSATATVALTSTPDFSLIGLPTEEDGTLVFDFVEQMCAAGWSTHGYELPCTDNNTQSSAGYVTQLGGEFQGLPSNMNVLLVHTPQENFKTIYGKYPAVAIQKGDRFRAVLACREHSFCDVEYELNFSDERGSAGLKNWHYLFIDEPIVVDYPLDALAGHTVQFTLAVRARGNPVQAYAVWIAPHIHRPVP